MNERGISMSNMTTEMIEALVEKRKNTTYTVQWDGGEMTVKETVGLSDIIAIAHNVAENCFDTEGEYFPEAKDTVMWSEIVSRYTDLELAPDINAQNDLFTHTDILDKLREFINIEQLGMIRDAIDERIQNMIAAGNNIMARDIIETGRSIGKLNDDFAKMMAAVRAVAPVAANIVSASPAEAPAKKPRKKATKTEG